jgi:RNA polymerase sigma-70 factor (ECF subfamily)
MAPSWRWRSLEKVTRAHATRVEIANEQPTLAAIHAAHADFVWRSLQRLGVPPADLEDALQEVFVVVHRRLSTFRGSSRLTTWLFGIAIRVASRFRRRAHLRREQAENPEHPPIDPGASPEANVLDREAREQLRQVLDAMDPARRAVFVMFEIERLRSEDISEQLGIPLGTVYSRLRAARAQFAKAASAVAKRGAR